MAMATINLKKKFNELLANLDKAKGRTEHDPSAKVSKSRGRGAQEILPLHEQIIRNLMGIALTNNKRLEIERDKVESLRNALQDTNNKIQDMAEKAIKLNNKVNELRSKISELENPELPPDSVG